MITYTTVSGDTWDSIAHKQMGNTLLANDLMEENIEQVFNVIFPAGITLNIPVIEESISDNLPPWKRGSG
ncbi:phage tail protein [Ureibacillus chungkukjangi]|uniref:phage tail protein n=1 Tax=Ureibacillus chungkukjangi TaxID=1202712 RepID=UPI00384B8FF0